MLQSFEISGFRAFQHLRLDRLGRVNLIVGKNNVGKTTLLEALWLYAGGCRPESIRELLIGRQEILPDRDPDTRDLEIELGSLFRGRLMGPNSDREISLGPSATSDETFKIRLTSVERVESPESSAPATTYIYEEISQGGARKIEGELFPALTITRGDNRQIIVRRNGSWSRALRRNRVSRSDIGPPFLRAGGVDDDVVGRWWDAVALLESEERVLECLNLLSPIAGVKLIENPSRFSNRVVVVRLKANPYLQPLKSLGDGVVRLFQTALALEYARRNAETEQLYLFGGQSSQNILLVDEVESGIHYSALKRFWGQLFQMAHSRNVQIVATTHSWDCIEAFQAACADNQGDDGMLIRLEARDGTIRAVTFDESELSIVTKEKIEVR